MPLQVLNQTIARDILFMEVIQQIKILILLNNSTNSMISKFFFLRQLEKIKIFLRNFHMIKKNEEFKFIFNNLKNKYELKNYDEKSF